MLRVLAGKFYNQTRREVDQQYTHLTIFESYCLWTCLSTSQFQGGSASSNPLATVFPFLSSTDAFAIPLGGESSLLQDVLKVSARNVISSI